jgi:hypothetical protein
VFNAELVALRLSSALRAPALVLMLLRDTFWSPFLDLDCTLNF